MMNKMNLNLTMMRISSLKDDFGRNLVKRARRSYE
jgi:hypothetical protein